MNEPSSSSVSMRNVIIERLTLQPFRRPADSALADLESVCPMLSSDDAHVNRHDHTDGAIGRTRRPFPLWVERLLLVGAAVIFVLYREPVSGIVDHAVVGSLVAHAVFPARFWGVWRSSAGSCKGLSNHSWAKSLVGSDSTAVRLVRD